MVMNETAKRSPRSTVLLLTSTAQPYQRDALDLVFLPSNTSYRFRYDKKWLSSDLMSADGEISKQKALGLKGKEAIIVHILIEQERGIENENRDYKVLEYLPLRKAVISQVKIIGRFLRLEFILGDWIAYEMEHEKGVNEHHGFFKKQIAASSDMLSGLVFTRTGIEINTIADKVTDPHNAALSNWNLIAGHVSRFASHDKELKKCPVMLKLIGVQDVEGESIVRPTNIGQGIYGFELISGKSYFFDIAEYCDEGIAPFELALKTDEKCITPTIGTVEVRGKYDVLRLMINCSVVDDDRLSMIRFEPIGLEGRGISSAFLWIKIKNRKWKNVGVPLIGFGLSTFITGTQFYNLITSQAVNYPVLAASAVGAIGSTISLWFLKR
jgi:hypothetical protein